MMVQRFEQSVKTHENRTAIKRAGVHITYGQLNRCANRIARALLSPRPGGDGDAKTRPVALLTGDEVTQVIAALAALKAGKIYVPLDISYPKQRLLEILSDSEAGTILMSAKTAKLAGTLAAEKSLEILDIDAIDDRVSPGNPGNRLDPGRIAYILYTSGSTGKPKGVAQTAENFLFFMERSARRLSIEPGDRVSYLSSFCHDGALTDIFPTLLSGACLCRFDIKNGTSSAGQWLKKEQITVYHSVPSVFRYLAADLKEDDRFAHLRLVILGGEAMRPQDISIVRRHFPTASLVNLYGMTEASIDTLGFITGKTMEEKITLGEPLEGIELVLLNDDGEEVEELETGEIYIQSNHIAAGYWKRPELTAASFFTSPDGARLYRTGDLGRLDYDGRIEFMGRKDNQVKIRGFRVETGEIETLLLNREGIKEAVVTAGETNGDLYLCAYVTMDGDRDFVPAEIRRFLLERLPDYMVPSYFVPMDHMPLTNSGKIDRLRLPQPQPLAEAAYQEPATPIERQLEEIWREVLNIDAETPVGTLANFFEIGGHSLNATIVLSKIHRALHVQIPLNYFFKEPVIGKLAQYIEQSGKSIYNAIQPVEEREYYPQTPAQQRLFFLGRFETVGTVYNISSAYRIEGELDGDACEHAVHGLIQRHEALRTSFHLIAGRPVQRVHEAGELDFQVTRYTQSPGDRLETPAILKDFVRPFDLQTAPLLRVGLANIDDREHVLLVDMHHIICDGTSTGILVDDFIRLYRGDKPEPLRIRYKDYALWRHRLFESGSIEKQVSYWLNLHGGQGGEIPVLDLPTDFPRPAVFNFDGARHGFTLDAAATGGVKDLGARLGITATVSMTVMTALNILLHKYTGQEDIIIGGSIMGRAHADLRQVIGMFVNTLALRSYPRPAETCGQYLKKVSQANIAAFENQDVPFEELVNRLNPPRDLSRNPLFDVCLTVQNFETARGRMASLSVAPMPLESRSSKFDITLYVMEGAENIHFSLEYRTALFKPQTIQRMAAHYITILQQMDNDPHIKIADLDIVTAEEKQQLLHHFNDTAASFPRGKTIHRLFEEQAEKTPDYIVSVGRAHELHELHEGAGDSILLTYRELNKKAGQLAFDLRERGVRPDDIVALKIERSIDMIIGILGILKAGGAYLPIDPANPQERSRFMIADSGAAITVTGNDIKPSSCSSSCPSWPNNPSSSLSYVIYTSGTTGRPKGTLVEHRSLVNLCAWHNRYYNVTPRDNAAQYAGTGFDASVWEIFPYLISGARLHIIAEDIKLDIPRLQRYYERNHITIAFLPTRFCHRFMEQDWSGGTLRALLTGGDKLDRCVEASYTLYNNYGPTENTVVATVYPVERPMENIPIGSPTANVRVYILNNSMQLQPIGVPGELCIQGGGLSRGYLNRPELTAEKFFYRTYRSYRTNKTYKTGDRARWLTDGTIQFLGRLDGQVKIRGFRIETGEIEHCLQAHEKVNAAAVAAVPHADGDKHLYAYIVTAESEAALPEIRRRLAAQLPSYMMPSRFIRLEKLPLTAAGKVDMKALPQPEGNRPQLDNRYLAPATAVEKTIADAWREVLKLDKIGIHDNFFDLGGNSMSLISVNQRLREIFQKDIPITEMFKYNTIGLLAGYIMRGEEVNKTPREIQPPVRPEKLDKFKTRAKKIAGKQRELRRSIGR
jgi:amino acid adenylation domain-containing protein